PNLLLIIAARAGAGARTETGTDLKPQAPRGADAGEEFSLIGEDHLLWLRTIAQPEPVVEPTDCFRRVLARGDRAECRLNARRERARQKQIRRWRAADADERQAPPQRLPLHVEARPPAADQLQFAQQP